MSKFEDAKKELKELVEEGKKLFECINADETTNIPNLNYFLTHYEMWYSRSLVVIKQIMPNREEDFIMQYKSKQQKELSHSTYTISDALRTTVVRNKNCGPHTAKYGVLRQMNMIQACLDSFDSKLHDLQLILQADIFDSEIESAKHLLKKGFLRAAGAICGVVLEKHFAEVCKNRSISINKKSPTIADFNDALKDNAYDVVEWRKIQHLGDIRNLCDHNKDREPTKEEVEELINGIDRVIKTIL